MPLLVGSRGLPPNSKGSTVLPDAKKTEVARAMPRPIAQLAAYVDILGPELTVTVLMTYGGAEMYLAADPKGHASHEALLGHDKAKALAAHPRLSARHRIPLAKRWLAAMLHWQDNSTASIARKLRVSDVSARRWLKEWKE